MYTIASDIEYLKDNLWFLHSDDEFTPPTSEAPPSTFFIQEQHEFHQPELRYFAALTRTWSLVSDCLIALGVKRHDAKLPSLSHLESEAVTSGMIALGGRMLTPCIIFDGPKGKGKNAYFIFDQERVLFVSPKFFFSKKWYFNYMKVEVDKERLGMARILFAWDIIHVNVTTGKEELSLVFQTQRIEFAQESKRRAIVLRNLFSSSSDDVSKVSKTFDVLWWGPMKEVRAIFTSGATAKQHVFDHVNNGRLERRLAAQKIILKHLK
jgi:hypothetical protein